MVKFIHCCCNVASVLHGVLHGASVFRRRKNAFGFQVFIDKFLGETAGAKWTTGL